MAHKKNNVLTIDIISIFPELLESFYSMALIARARAKNIIELNAINLRGFAHHKDNHMTVDDRPYGGGAGMVLMAEPIIKAVASLRKGKKKLRRKIIAFSPKGKKFDQKMARSWSKLDHLIMICGRYEGIDERIAKYVADDEISIGDYVLFGGEVPAMVVTEAITRLLPGALGKQSSLVDETFNTTGQNKSGDKQLKKFYEYPHYTRPESISINGKVKKVPKVLLSGDHKAIEKWRKRNSKWL